LAGRTIWAYISFAGSPFGRLGIGKRGISEFQTSSGAHRWGIEMDQVIEVVESKEEVVELTLEQLEMVGGGCVTTCL
jgi:hypothetical protein